jgi:hypothetical protein
MVKISSKSVGISLCASIVSSLGFYYENILKNGGFQFAPEKHESIFRKAVVLSMIDQPVEDKQLRADYFERSEKLSL